MLCIQCRGIGPHLTAREKSRSFPRVAGAIGCVCSSYGGDDPSKLVFVQRHQESCLVTRDNSGISSRLGKAIRTLLEVRQETQCPFIVPTVILGFLLIFTNCQASSPFEALNSTGLTRYQIDVRPPVQVRRGTRFIPRVSTGDSDIPSSCEMKGE